MAMNPDLKKLKKSYPQLSDVFSRDWQTPLEKYARRLYRSEPRKLEPALTTAFEAELLSMDVSSACIDRILDQLQHIPVLQTSHHITPTHGPTFLALDLICLSGLSASEFYLVGANSGVAFSNSAWSGALSYGNLPLERLLDPGSEAFRRAEKSQQERIAHGDPDRRVSLIPARQRDRLVFGTPLSANQFDIQSQFNPNLQGILPEVHFGQPFSLWSAKASTEIQNRIFNTRQVLIFDLNRVIARYLADVLANQTDHPCSVILSDSITARQIQSVFRNPPMFLGNYQNKKSDKVDPLTWRGSGTDSRKSGFRELGRSELIKQLTHFKLCPGLFILFFILRFLNGIRCLGSFNQIGYLETFREQWQETAVDWPLELTSDHANSLTTGRLLQNGRAVWPLDLVLNHQQLSLDDFSDLEMGQFWQPVLDQLTIPRRTDWR